MSLLDPSPAGLVPTPGVWASGDRPKYLWWDLRHELVSGEPMSPLTRAAYLADTASPLSGWGSAGLEVINCDVSLALVRDPEGSMLGLAARDFLSGPGTSNGSAVMHDRLGPVGLVTVVALPFSPGRTPGRTTPSS